MMFYTKQVDKRPSWYKGYDTLGPNENSEKAYEVVGEFDKVQFNTIEEAEDAARKIDNFWTQNFIFKDGK